MKDADASHFFHLLSLEGEALAPAPPKMTDGEKWAFLAAQTKGEEMDPRTADEYRSARNERMKALRSGTI